MATVNILGVPHTYELTPPVSQTDRPVLVFIHGWLLSRHYWRPLVEKLSPDYQCLLYDLRGFGESQGESPNPRNYSLQAYGEDLGILLETLKIKQAWLMGHSLGGSIALWTAQSYPNCIEGVVCLNAGGGIYLKEEFERFRAAGQQIVKRRPKWLCYIPFLDLVFCRAMVDQTLPRLWGRQRLFDFVQASYQAALGSLLESTTESEVHLLPQVVARLSQPVYFLAGEQDMVMEPKYVNHLASFHPLFEMTGANVMQIANCGHLSMVEQTEAVYDQIRGILDQYCKVSSVSLPSKK
ncbi:alpha/beta fold hydrolase [Spirulina subsalsa]|uniref:alpha/beta fold hydrolase n=1 Tax=Spirulina subsalsa TaxID=54311 RepID=UPI0002ED25AA|nr:alpha/beta hydrolase [Spirulina subsalsa]